ncbi:MAG: cytochrome-c peroxidase [Legionellales bacterium]|nr:cytochrome-c peroxidase [Legionellales bacterium]
MSVKIVITIISVCLTSTLYAINPIPRPTITDPAKVALGEKLYHDTLLSADGTISCATCHDLNKGGVDGLPVSKGIHQQNGVINAPTVYNSAHNFVQFWDGRAKDLAEQAKGPVENPLEMGDTWPNVVKKIKANQEYQALFAKSYQGVISEDTIVDAISAFEKTLDTPDSPFDHYLRGDKQAISPLAQKGYELFQTRGCVACHNGDYFGGTMYQRLNPDYFKERNTPITTADLGRYNVTHNEADKYFFKVPMLRNIAVTAPYYHDGQVKTLDEAVTKMAKYQLGQTLSGSDVKALVAFLQSLTGTYKNVPLDKMGHSRKN